MRELKLYRKMNEREGAAFDKALAALDGLSLTEAWRVAAKLESLLSRKQEDFCEQAMAMEPFKASSCRGGSE
jgi:hypothetical protein